MSHWRQQQQQDTYFRQAKKDGYRARSVYKLLQIQEKFKVIRQGDVVIDLGAAPGSWSQALVKLVGRHGRVVSVDLQAIAPIEGVTFFQGDMTDPELQAKIVALVDGHADAVLSDAAPSTSGIKLRDHVLSVELARAAFRFAHMILKPGGNLIVKVFQGEDLAGLIRDVKKDFKEVKLHAPPATRSESWEVFIVARGFKGASA